MLNGVSASENSFLVLFLLCRLFLFIVRAIVSCGPKFDFVDFIYNVALLVYFKDVNTYKSQIRIFANICCSIIEYIRHLSWCVLYLPKKLTVI